MKNLAAMALVFSVIHSASAAMPSPDTGNFWQKACNESGTDGRATCAAYIQGIIRGTQLQAQLSQSDSYLCLPQQVTMLQTTDVFAKYLREHPEDRHRDATSLVYKALRTAFPCAEKETGKYSY